MTKIGREFPMTIRGQIPALLICALSCLFFQLSWNEEFFLLNAMRALLSVRKLKTYKFTYDDISNVTYKVVLYIEHLTHISLTLQLPTTYCLFIWQSIGFQRIINFLKTPDGSIL